MAAAAAEHTGRCNCGAVSYGAAGPLRPPIACHCKSCRRQSSHFLVATQVDRAGLRLQGEENLAWFAATPHARRGFCRRCGVHLFWQAEGSERISLLAGALDDPTGLRLASHIYVDEKGDYYDIVDGLPQYSEDCGG